MTRSEFAASIERVDQFLAKRGSFPQKSTFGKKGGVGPNSGKKASTYQVTFADGTTARKRSFRVHRDVAVAYVSGKRIDAVFAYELDSLSSISPDAFKNHDVLKAVRV